MHSSARGFSQSSGLMELPVNIDPIGHAKPSKPTPRYTSVSPIPLPCEAASSSSASPAEEEVFIVPKTLELEAVVHPAALTKAMVENIASDDWTEQFHGITSLRRLCRFAPEVVEGVIESVVLHLTEACMNLRSAISRNALYALRELLALPLKSVAEGIEPIIEVLVTRAAADKQFLRDAAEEALLEIPNNSELVNEDVLMLVLVQAESKAPLTAAAAAKVTSALLKRMHVEQVKLLPVDILLQATAAYSCGGTPAARGAAKTILVRMKAAYGTPAVLKFIESAGITSADKLKLRKLCLGKPKSRIPKGSLRSRMQAYAAAGRATSDATSDAAAVPPPPLPSFAATASVPRALPFTAPLPAPRKAAAPSTSAAAAWVSDPWKGPMDLNCFGDSDMDGTDAPSSPGKVFHGHRGGAGGGGGVPFTPPKPKPRRLDGRWKSSPPNPPVFGVGCSPRKAAVFGNDDIGMREGSGDNRRNMELETAAPAGEGLLSPPRHLHRTIPRTPGGGSVVAVSPGGGYVHAPVPLPPALASPAIGVKTRRFMRLRKLWLAGAEL